MAYREACGKVALFQNQNIHIDDRHPNRPLRRPMGYLADCSGRCRGIIASSFWVFITDVTARGLDGDDEAVRRYETVKGRTLLFYRYHAPRLGAMQIAQFATVYALRAGSLASYPVPFDDCTWNSIWRPHRTQCPPGFLPRSRTARDKRSRSGEHAPDRPERLISFDEVHHRTGLSRTTIWRLERAGEFPRSVQISRWQAGLE